jgi:arylsulfatase A-like enzyme
MGVIRYFGYAILLTHFSCTGTEVPPASTAPAPAPNIIWLVAEDISPRFAAYGDSLAHTPHLNALARRGIVYDNAFTTAGVCAPSRSSLITGAYQTSIGTQHMRQRASVIPMPGFPRYSAVPPPEVKAFPELLRAAGYWTASYTKLDYQFGDPFTVWDTVNYYPHWRQRSGEDAQRPFFLYRTYEITHEINIWPDTTKERFYRDFGLDKRNLAPDVRERPPFDESYAVDPTEVSVPPYLPDTEVARRHVARLYDNASRMDRQIGELLEDLEEDGLADNTIIFFLSDHGDCLPRAKRWIYDSGLRIPLVVYLPERYAHLHGEAGRDDRLVSGVDLAPTVLRLAGVPVPEWVQGVPIFGEREREYVFAARDRMDNRYDTRRAVGDGRWKYIKNYRPEVAYSQQITFLDQMPLMAEIQRLHAAGALGREQSYWLEAPKPEEELYDTATDPHELVNLAGDPAYRDELLRLRQALTEWQDRHGDYLLMPETEQAEAMWPGGKQPVTAEPVARRVGDRIELTTPTAGATIAYRPVGEQRWEIYTGPVPAGAAYEARAVRYGYAASGVSITYGGNDVRGQ